MRHGKKFNHLSRTASHRKAMLSNMASSLIEHKRISTTVAKAKALRKYVEVRNKFILIFLWNDQVSFQNTFGSIINTSGIAVSVTCTLSSAPYILF